jgi:hypothetical protein
MKVTATAAVLLAAAGSTDAWSQPTRSTLRNLGQKSVSFQGPSRTVGASMKMEGESLSSWLLSMNRTQTVTRS